MIHVLLLEPNTLLVQAYTAALQQSGCTVTAVTGAQQAIHAADRQRPDMVIVELQLPGHNGIEFLHEFRSYSEWRQVPVLVHTTLLPSTSARYRHALQDDLGVYEILYKPTTTLADLVRAVRQGVIATA